MVDQSLTSQNRAHFDRSVRFGADLQHFRFVAHRCRSYASRIRSTREKVKLVTLCFAKLPSKEVLDAERRRYLTMLAT